MMLLVLLLMMALMMMKVAVTKLIGRINSIVLLKRTKMMDFMEDFFFTVMKKHLILPFFLRLLYKRMLLCTMVCSFSVQRYQMIPVWIFLLTK